MAPKKKQEEKIIDEAVEESFPASDAPAWTAKTSTNEPTFESYKLTLTWQRTTSSFEYEMYNRDALLTFGGGESIRVSNPPLFFGDSHYANSEELLIAALASCYMQTFLAICSKQGYIVNRYLDRAVGKLGKNETNKMLITEIVLNLTITFEGKEPRQADLIRIRDKAHEYCFIANTLRSKIMIHLQ